METKLQQLTEKLYNEGLAKGQQEGREIVAKARAEAENILAQAKAAATKTAADAATAAAELKKNTENELRLASSQMVSTLRQQIERMVVTEIVKPQVSAAWSDGKFVKELILTAVGAFKPTAEEPVKLMVPAAMAAEVQNAVAEKFAKGVEVVTEARLKVPFRIAPGNGGYFVSFTDDDFSSLLQAYLRPKVAELLFDKK